jgi:NADPH:quinone reductase-like Zn-dependent oxidoreductase
VKAIICTKYGIPDSFSIQDIPVPVPLDNEVLVEVHASSVTTHNVLMVKGEPYFVRFINLSLLGPKYRIPGSDTAGRVISIGKNVKRFKPGDEVFGEISDCGFGAYAEYVSVPEDVLIHKPANLSFNAAAAVPLAALAALQGLRDKGHIQKNQKVLIFGASGGIGTFAVQIAKYFGAEVTGVCSTGNLELVKSLGADHLIDYTKEDFSKSDSKYDLIFAISYSSIFAHKKALSPDGTFVSTGGPSLSRVFQDMLLGPIMSKFGNNKFVGGWIVNINVKDLTFIRELIEAGKIKIVIDSCYPLDKAADAFRYFEKGHTRGRVIISLNTSWWWMTALILPAWVA